MGIKDLTYRLTWVLLTLLLLAISSVADAQNESRASRRRRHLLQNDSIVVSAADSIEAANQEQLMELQSPVVIDVKEADSVQLKKQWIPNPTKATWMALVFPGGGQIYNKKYWKLPIFYAGFAGCAYALTWNNRMYKDYSAAYKDAQITVTAIVGMIGIRPTIEAIKAGKDIALANKETLVTAGHIIMPLARKCGVKILPVDSEHSAIFQSLNGEEGSRIEKILLTCSGGPFRGYTKQQLSKVTVEDALRHPNWNMGRKITVDSASLVNKGLEVMEAGWLFGVPGDRIEVVVQPQSIIHSAVQFTDGAVIAQLGTPDMRLPIQYALFYPQRREMDTERLNLFQIGSLTFEKPDTDTFRGLTLARRAMAEGGTMPTVFNAANEIAVAHFLARRIGFLDIYRLIEECMDSHRVTADPDVDQILDAEKEAGEKIASMEEKNQI